MFKTKNKSIVENLFNQKNKEKETRLPESSTTSEKKFKKTINARKRAVDNAKLLASFWGFGLNYHLFMKDFLKASGEEITILRGKLEEYELELEKYLSMNFDRKVASIRATITALQGVPPGEVAKAINDYKLILN